jgi:hypothetical protein
MSQLALVSRVLVQRAIAMREVIVAMVAILLNVTVSFATDGQWKTAGLGLMTAYWRLNRFFSTAHSAA